MIVRSLYGTEHVYTSSGHRHVLPAAGRIKLAARHLVLARLERNQEVGLRHLVLGTSSVANGHSVSQYSCGTRLRATGACG